MEELRQRVERGMKRGREDRLREARAGGQRKWGMERQKNHGKRGVGKEGGRQSKQETERVCRGWMSASADPQRGSIFLGESLPSSPGTEGKV